MSCVEEDKAKEVFKGLRDLERANGDPDQVDCISMDMYPAYVSEEYFNAAVYDKFYVINQMNDAVDKVRRGEAKENELLKKTKSI